MYTLRTDLCTTLHKTCRTVKWTNPLNSVLDLNFDELKHAFVENYFACCYAFFCPDDLKETPITESEKKESAWNEQGKTLAVYNRWKDQLNDYVLDDRARQFMCDNEKPDISERIIQKSKSLKAFIEILKTIEIIIIRKKKIGNDFGKRMKQLSNFQTRDLEKMFDGLDCQPDVTCEFQAYLLDCARKWKRQNYIAPYVALVQGSGVGKSFSIRKISETQISMEMCLRSEKSKSYPYRSAGAKIISDFEEIKYFMLNHGNLFSNDPSVMVVTFYVSFLWGYLGHLESTLVKMNGELDAKYWNSLQTKKDGDSFAGQKFWTDVSENMILFLENLKLNMPAQNSLHDTELVNILKFYTQELKKRLDNIGKLMKSTTEATFLLFSFDEASCLAQTTENGFNLFRHFLFALSRLPDNTENKGLKCIAVFTDTWSRITNFLPSKDHSSSDNSLRFLENDHLKPYTPYWTYRWGTRNTVDWTMESDWTSGLENMYLSTGRPLWNALRKVAGADFKNSVMSTAAAKLLDVTSTNTTLEWTMERVASLYGCILALQFHNNRQLSEDIVRSHMGTVYCVSENREFVWWGYPSEPILPASIIFARWDWLKNYGYEQHLNLLLRMTQSGMVDAGYRGELVSRLLLLDAYANAVLKQSIMELPGPISLDQFLDQLYVPPNSVTWEQFFKNNKQEDYLNYRVFLTHFIYTTYTVTDKDIFEYFLRGAGVHCRRHHIGIDHIIPLWNSKTKKTSYILISVKNQQKITSESKDASFLCDPFRIGVQTDNDSKDPFIILWMEVQPEVKTQKFEEPIFGIQQRKRTRENRNSPGKPYLLLQSYGLCPSFLVSMENSGICEKMRQLALAYTDPLQIHQSVNPSGNNIAVLKDLLHKSYVGSDEFNTDIDERHNSAVEPIVNSKESLVSKNQAQDLSPPKKSKRRKI